MVKQSFTKLNRLLKRADYLYLKRHATRKAGKYCSIDFLPTDRPARLGITVTKKFGSSVERNRFKRRVRECFRCHYSFFSGYDINIFAKKEAGEATLQSLTNELLTKMQELQKERKK